MASVQRAFRVSFDYWAMRFAEVAAIRSTCLGAQVGAAIFQGSHLIATGYNGMPSGVEHCTDRGYCHPDYPTCTTPGCPPSRAIHAEMNAIAQCAKYGQSTQGATLYCTLQPCLNCMKAIAASGIKRVVYRDSKPGVEYGEFTSGLEVEQL